MTERPLLNFEALKARPFLEGGFILIFYGSLAGLIGDLGSYIYSDDGRLEAVVLSFMRFIAFGIYYGAIVHKQRRLMKIASNKYVIYAFINLIFIFIAHGLFFKESSIGVLLLASALIVCVVTLALFYYLRSQEFGQVSDSHDAQGNKKQQS